VAYEDARKGYVVRDDRCAVIDAWSVGLVRRALIEAGRRLADKGLLENAAHAVELTRAEAQALLAGQAIVDAATVATRARTRAEANIDDMPMTLGPPPGKPPPAAWLPKGAREIHDALFTYLDMMDREDEGPKEATHAKGMGASGGKHVGTARLVLTPGELGKVKRGDVLIARCTMPTYNAVLPLVGGIATDRGGVLSHAAIVSRELGIPGVVGCGDVTKKIPDGARVIIDGDAGTVRVAA
jgi:phosphohistidine swiveling domain-containing protein